MIKVVQQFKPDTVFMGRLERGADIITSLEAFCLEHNIQAGWVNLLGALDRATISYYDQKKRQYFHRTVEDDYEIVSCSGNISLKDEKPFAHLHIVLSNSEYQTIGGHLWPDSVSVFAAEFVLFKLGVENSGDLLVRCPDLETGLTLW